MEFKPRLFYRVVKNLGRPRPLKSIIKSDNLKKKSTKVLESENLSKPKCPSATINPYHPDYPDINMIRALSAFLPKNRAFHRANFFEK